MTMNMNRAVPSILALSLGFAIPGSAMARAAGQDLRPIAITVDDLPIAAPRLHATDAEREKLTRELLAVLAKHKIRAVGFVIGQRIADGNGAKLLEAWLDAGHELGNHTFSHGGLSGAAVEPFLADAERGRLELVRILAPRNRSIRYFRFPMLHEGDTREALEAGRRYLAGSGQINLSPTIDNPDYAFEEEWVMARRRGDRPALDRIADAYQRAMRLDVEAQESLADEFFGRRVPQILLLHANEVGAAQWDALFGWLESTGHRFAAADDVLKDPAVNVSHSFIFESGPGLWYRLRADRDETQAREAMASVLNAQAAAWNRGDMESFCAVYAEDAVLVSPNDTSRGQKEILARYNKKYPDEAARGNLKFEPLEMRLFWGRELNPMGDTVPSRIHGGSVLARWTLSYPGRAPASGRTLIVLQRTGKSWRIVQDASF
jgi:peptidoglycan-N-acetylglucosamine deacetylase